MRLIIIALILVGCGGGGGDEPQPNNTLEVRRNLPSGGQVNER